MIRAQVQLDEATYEALRHRAFAEKKSLSAVVRELLSQALGEHGGKPRKGRRRFTFIGIARGSKSDVSARHDDYLNQKKRW